MAVAKGNPTEVELGSAPIDRFRPLLTEARWSEFERTMSELVRRARGRTVWNVNSTGRGGGVAELLAALIPYGRGAGIDERWLVLEGSPEFFDVTKKIHTMLHGVAPDGTRITEADRGIYEETLGRNAAAMRELMRPGDVAILHDPQTAGLIRTLSARGMGVVWRSHVGIDEPNEAVRSAWAFLRPYVADARAFIFSRRAYVIDGLDAARVHIIAPCIDPFATKNQDMSPESVSSILHACGILRGSDGAATFLRHDGTEGRIVHSAHDGLTGLPEDARMVVQVSRWDRLKDPAGVLDAFVDHVGPATGAWLVLAGPAATSVKDDPEQPEILRALNARREAIDGPMRDRVLIAQLPMDDTEENAAIVNALQRRAAVVVQKSLAEGFGLTVAEAMWKARPVVASRVGGIEDQIEDGVSGLLIGDPRDLRTFGEAVARVLRDGELARRLGDRARTRVAERFLAPRHLMEQARLISGLLD